MAQGAPVARGDAQRGGVLFAQNCQGCHGMGGRGGMAPELANPTFQQSAADGFIITTIRHGRTATAMPAFQNPTAPALTDAELGDLLAYIRGLGQQTAVAQLASGRAGGTP